MHRSCGQAGVVRAVLTGRSLTGIQFMHLAETLQKCQSVQDTLLGCWGVGTPAVSPTLLEVFRVTREHRLAQSKVDFVVSLA